MQALEVIQLKKTYANGVEALRGVSLSVEKGDFFALLGPNGAGKTTLIGIVGGLVTKTGGEVFVGGVDATKEPERARTQIGLVPQEFNFKGRFFTDIGSSGKLASTGPEIRDSGTPRVSIGTGVAWASPVGPLGMDLGFPILKESFDDTELFRVNFGTRF